MAIYEHLESGKRFLFIHIPRTGGRFVEKNLEAYGWDWDKCLGLDKKYKFYNSVEQAHFHREYYEKYYDVKDIPHICIVRNPIDRFISASIYLKKAYGDDIQELMEDEMYFDSMIHNLPLEGSYNWYRPQVDYISDKTHIWKLEDGLGEEFSSWISGIVGVDIRMDKSVKYYKFSYETNKLKKTDALIERVKLFYRKDFSALNYEIP
jgi:hypothetical protein